MPTARRVKWAYAHNTMQSIFYLQVLEKPLSFQPQEQKDGDHAANSSDTKPDGPWASRLNFVEDFLLEHAVHGNCITSTEISGSF